MPDKMETLACGSVIQHGKHNDRIYLMKRGSGDAQETLEVLYKLAVDNDYTKLFCKVPASEASFFHSCGFGKEAFIPAFYDGKDDVVFLSKFLNSDRKKSEDMEPFQTFLMGFQEGSSGKKVLPDKFTIRQLDETDAVQITKIYEQIFLSYPFPIHDPAYIVETMRNNVQYYGVEEAGQLAAVSSAEIDFKGANAEMTDFATNTAYQGNSLASFLLEKMEEEMEKQGLKTLYTIARLKSLAMNKTFLKSGYTYTGTLVNNTNIAGNIESMNVYYKHI